jgi:hypothetical protein
MGWWNKLFGKSRPSEEPPAATFPATVTLIPGKLSVRVFLHDIANGRDRIPCWTYVTDGLWDAGQKEMIFSLRRHADEEPEAVPQDPLRFFAQVHQLAASGQFVDAGGHTCFRNPAGFLGRTEMIGFAYAPPECLPDVELPPLERALVAILLTPEEAELVQMLGSYRILTRLGQSVRRYPFPPWSERGRQFRLSRAEMQESLLGKFPLAYYAGATARMLVPPMEPAAAGQDRHGTLQATRITLRLPTAQPPGFRETVEPFADSWMLGLLTRPDPEANARLVWNPGQAEMQAIMPENSDASCVTGGFVALVAEPSLPDGARVLEDGFLVTLGPATRGRVKEALLARQSCIVAPSGPDLIEFALEWLPEANEPASAASVEAPPAGGPAAFEVSQVFLYQPEEVLQRRLADSSVFAKYMKQVMDAATRYWATVPRQRGRGAVLVAAVKPGGRSRFWLETEPAGLGASLVEGLYRALEQIPAPLVRGGPVAVAMQASLWGGGEMPGGFPPIPTEWRQASESEGRNLLVPDEVLAVVWPD